jgi:molybdopterin synthase catalytic subunit
MPAHETAGAAFTHVRLKDGRIEVDALVQAVAAHSNGATVLFMGSVRDTHNGRAVDAIDYSAYVPMAEKVLNQIVGEAVARFEPVNVALEHRLGHLRLGEISVAIAAAHPRRTAAFDAARYIIEELKRRAPIWKREHYSDGTREWVVEGTDLRFGGSEPQS